MFLWCASLCRHYGITERQEKEEKNRILAVFKISATLERAMVTESAFRIFCSPVSTPVTISNLGIDLGVMAKLKPFSSTAVCVLLSLVLLKLVS